MERVLAEEPMQIGGAQAVAEIPANYDGPCSVLTINDELVATLPDKDVAYAVARYAIKPEGGFGDVYVRPAREGQEPITHELFASWAFGF
ncbi:hypothetical protein ACNO5E_01965 [Vibrio parahaemolyticus]